MHSCRAKKYESSLTLKIHCIKTKAKFKCLHLIINVNQSFYFTTPLLT